MRRNVIIGIAVLVLAIAFILIGRPVPHTQSYFECDPGATLVVCPVGESPSPPQECTAVGSGATSLREGACS